jgi:flagellar biosynthesis chaperone FliJ
VTLTRLAQLYEAEQERNDRVRAARRRRDAATVAYHRAQRQLATLEQASTKTKTEPALQSARDAVERTRRAWQQAQRELLRSIS